MAKVCNRCGKGLINNEVYYCEECRQMVRQEYEAKEIGQTDSTNNAKSTNVSSDYTRYLEQSNTIGNAVKILGIVFIVISIILGLVMGSQTGGYDGYYQETSFNWGVALMIMIGGSFYGLMIMAIGEIVLLLQGSNNRLNALLRLMENQQNKQQLHN